MNENVRRLNIRASTHCDIPVEESKREYDERGEQGGVTARLIAAEYSGLIVRMFQEVPPSSPPLPPPLPVAGVPPPPPRPLGWGKGLLLCLIFQSIAGTTIVMRSLAEHLGWKVDTTTAALIDMICAWPATLLLACVIAPVNWRHAFPFTRFSLSLLAPLLIAVLGCHWCSSK